MLEIKNIENINISKSIVFILGFIGLITVIALDKLYWGVGILVEGYPDLTAGHIVRSMIIFISTLAILLSLIGITNKQPIFGVEYNSGIPLEQSSALGVVFISIIILLLFIFEPSIFNVLSLEDSIIEWVSASLLFASCIIIYRSFSKISNISNIPKVTKVSMFFLSLVLFIVAMEEVSWFQRILEIETLKIFAANDQNEMNLHNFYTSPIENIYYFGTFLFLVVLPYIRFLFPYISNNNYFRIFVPRPFIAVIGSIACAYNFDMWNVIFTQIAFFGSIIILFVFFIFTSKNDKKYIISFIILIITTQALFLTHGENFARLWEVTEYKEFFIPLVLFIYSLDVFKSITSLYLSDKK